MAERFQPRTLASFTLHQLTEILEWGEINNIYLRDSFLEDLDNVLDTTGVDERGKVMSEKGKARIEYGYLLMLQVSQYGDLTRFNTGSVWLVSELPKLFEFRWKHHGDSLESRASETRFLGRV